MLIDGRNIPRDHTIHMQVCIVGAGPAGLTVAQEYLDQNIDVCLLESGGFE